MKTIGAFEAKSHLSKLLAKVANGERFLITIRGKPVASLCPVSEETRHGVRERVAVFRRRMADSFVKISNKELQNFKKDGRR